MQLQTMTDRGLCLPTAFAMALDMPVECLLSQLRGWHDVIFQGLPEPLCWRGIHIQEIIPLALSYGYAVTPREMYPQIAAPRAGFDNYVIASESSEQDIVDCVLLSQGVLTGVRDVAGRGMVGHAVAYDHGIVYDPNGYSYAFSKEECGNRNYFPQCAWRVDRIL